MKDGGGLTQMSRWRLLTIYPAVKAAASVRSDVESQRGKNTTTHARVHRAVDKLEWFTQTSWPVWAFILENPAHGPAASA